MGQPIGVVAADSEAAARAAAAAVAVEYEDLPAILDIEAAIAGGSSSVAGAGLEVEGCCAECEGLPAVLDVAAAIQGARAALHGLCMGLRFLVEVGCGGPPGVPLNCVGWQLGPGALLRSWPLPPRMQTARTFEGWEPARAVASRAFPPRTALPRPPPPHRAANSFYEGWGHSVESGDVEAALSSADCELLLEGETKMGGQVGCLCGQLLNGSVRRWRSLAKGVWAAGRSASRQQGAAPGGGARRRGPAPGVGPSLAGPCVSRLRA